jgi:hypothetical protein
LVRFWFSEQPLTDEEGYEMKRIKEAEKKKVSVISVDERQLREHVSEV